MITSGDVLRALSDGRPVPGRHLLVTAHPDDETISFGGALCLIADVRLVVMTHGVPPESDPELVSQRLTEQRAAMVAGGWDIPVMAGILQARTLHDHLLEARWALSELMADVDVVWTHPYEAGHLDHDSCAWLVQDLCGTGGPLRMEFASYHATRATWHQFGVFWPDVDHPAVSVRYVGHEWRRKQAAIQAYGSQLRVLGKFPNWQVEHYRSAPWYDFTRPAPPSASRWDRRGTLTPTTAEWRAIVLRASILIGAMP
jgi:LmbE family N-acetylglucosaminyl deacetylase